MKKKEEHKENPTSLENKQIEVSPSKYKFEKKVYSSFHN